MTETQQFNRLDDRDFVACAQVLACRSMERGEAARRDIEVSTLLVMKHDQAFAWSRLVSSRNIYQVKRAKSRSHCLPTSCTDSTLSQSSQCMHVLACPAVVTGCVLMYYMMFC